MNLTDLPESGVVTQWSVARACTVHKYLAFGLDTSIEISVISRQLEGTLSEQTILTAQELCVHAA